MHFNAMHLTRFNAYKTFNCVTNSHRVAIILCKHYGCTVGRLGGGVAVLPPPPPSCGGGSASSRSRSSAWNPAALNPSSSCVSAARGELPVLASLNVLMTPSGVLIAMAAIVGRCFPCSAFQPLCVSVTRCVRERLRALRSASCFPFVVR
jgi:hypothetical protein